MRVEDMLEQYVREVAGQLPVKMRSDVALELASLLREDLHARAEAAGRAPDEALARDVLQAFGNPYEVAARYHPKGALIDPSDTRNVVMTVVVGGALLLAATIPTALLAPAKLHAPETYLVWWIGAVVLFYACKAWARRRWPKQRGWTPGARDPDRVSRIGIVAIILSIGLSIAIFGAPEQSFAWLTKGRHLTGSLAYDPQFRALRLPWLFGIWAGQAVMLAMIAWRGRWTPALRRVDMVLTASIVVLFLWWRADGPVMVEPVANVTAKAYMAMIATFLVIELAVRIYRQAGQVSADELQATLNP